MNWWKNIGRDRTKQSWCIILIVLLAAITGLWLLPLAATKWEVLLKFKDNIYTLIGQLFNTIWLPVANALGVAHENTKKSSQTQAPIPAITPQCQSDSDKKN
ncbi:MAG TPA: hypothetical protein DDW65_21580 [Firmicutes bacterium]|nr:hypothetical protein [Bacillota bacterium]